MVRNSIVLVKRDSPVRVTLPNGRTFLAKFKKVKRNQLPANVTIARIYRGRPAQGRRPTSGRRPPARAKPAAAVRAPNRAAAVAPGIVIRPARPKTRAARSALWRRQRQGGRGLGDVVKIVASNP